MVLIFKKINNTTNLKKKEEAKKNFHVRHFKYLL